MKKSLIFLFLLNTIIFSQSVSFNTGNMRIEVLPYGRLKMYVPVDTTEMMNVFWLTPLAGESADRVFDIYNDAGIEDTTKLLDSARLGNYEIYGAYNNTYDTTAPVPPNYIVRQNVYAWSGSKFALIKYTIVNREEYQVTVKIGAELVTQADGIIGFDTIKYDSGRVDVFKDKHIGFKILNVETTNMAAFNWYAGYQQDSSYWQWLNTPVALDTIIVSDTLGPVIIPSAAPVMLAPGDSTSIWCGLTWGDSTAEVNKWLDSAYAYSINPPPPVTSVNEHTMPLSYRLEQNYPNPFNPSTKIRYTIPAGREQVTLKIYDILGKEVATLVNEEKPGGSYEVMFNASSLSSGVYLYRLKAGSFVQTKKLMLLK